MYRLCESVHDHPRCVMPSRCLWQVSHKIHRDVLPLPLCYLQRLEEPRQPLVFKFYPLTRETPMNKIPNFLLHSTPGILAMKIMVHLRATWMYRKTRAVELLEDLLSQICLLGNHNSSPIPKTTIRVNGLAFVTCT